MAATKAATKPAKRAVPGKRRMTAEQFDVVRPYLTRMSKRRIDAARLALVEDRTLSSIAKRFGWSSRQNVSDAVNDVFTARARFEATQVMSSRERIAPPPGWEVVTLTAPPEFITRWRKELASEFAKFLNGKTAPRRTRERRG